MTRGAEPETCTVELSTGSFVHLASRPGLVLAAQDDFADRLANRREALCRADLTPRSANRLYQFERVVGPGVNWRTVWLDVTQIVAIYPIGERPEPQRINSVLTVGIGT